MQNFHVNEENYASSECIDSTKLISAIRTNYALIKVLSLYEHLINEACVIQGSDGWKCVGGSSLPVRVVEKTKSNINFTTSMISV